MLLRQPSLPWLLVHELISRAVRPRHRMLRYCDGDCEFSATLCVHGECIQPYNKPVERGIQNTDAVSKAVSITYVKHLSVCH